MIYTVIDSFTNPVYGIMDYIRTQAFGYAKMGLGSALSWIYFTIILIVLGLLTLLFSKRMTYIENN
jgi:ABC-type sugar transport system permease subunit